MGRPGPGEVLQFAEEVKKKCYWGVKPLRVSATLETLAWVLGEQNKHPITEQPTSQFPPDIETITEVAKEARAARKDSKLRSEYCAAVCDCLEWINGSNQKRPRL